MDFPDDTLVDLLMAAWTLSTEGLTTDDITFTTEDWSEELGIHAPYICVRHLGLTRDQPVEAMAEFSFLVQVIWWPMHLNEVNAKKALQWAIIEEIRRIIDDIGTGIAVPTKWQSAWWDRLANVSVLGAAPNVLIENIVVKAKIYWT